MIFDNPNELHAKWKLTLRTTREDEPVTDAQSTLEFWFTPKKWYIKQDGKYYPVQLNGDNKKVGEARTDNR